MTREVHKARRYQPLYDLVEAFSDAAFTTCRWWKGISWWASSRPVRHGGGAVHPGPETRLTEGEVPPVSHKNEP